MTLEDVEPGPMVGYVLQFTDFRRFGLFADSMIGRDFRGGLANPKALAERR